MTTEVDAYKAATPEDKTVALDDAAFSKVKALVGESLNLTRVFSEKLKAQPAEIGPWFGEFVNTTIVYVSAVKVALQAEHVDAWKKKVAGWQGLRLTILVGGKWRRLPSRRHLST